MNKAKIYYHDIGDYLSREEKLSIVKKFGSIVNVPMQELTPNEHGDWISMRNDAFDTFIPLAPEKKFDLKTQTIFTIQSPGLLSSRESWVYNFSKSKLSLNMTSMVDYYEKQRKNLEEIKIDSKKNDITQHLDNNPQKISWTRALRNDISKNIEHQFSAEFMTAGILRPYLKQNLYYDRSFIESPALFAQLFPSKNHENLLICVSGVGANKLNCIYITDKYIDYNAIDAGAKCFPLFYYEENNSTQKGLFDSGDESEYIRRDGVSDFILERAIKIYGKNVSKEDIFYYVYGFLHSPEYRETFANDLKKMLPRLPLVEDVRDFWAFSKAGRKLAELHLNYESVAAFPDVQVTGDDGKSYRVEKMRFPKKGQKDTIIYNSKITISSIPAEAYEYVVNGKSAIEWIMERYQITTHKDSGITNDPNDWADEVGNPRYILDLLLSIINVSVQTVGVVKELPKIQFND